MKRFVLTLLPSLGIGCLILFYSLWHTSSLEYKFSPTPPPAHKFTQNQPNLIYKLPEVGKIDSTSPLWPIKALGQKVWLEISPNQLVRAERALAYADERLANATKLFEQQKPSEAVAVLIKAEKYLEHSWQQTQLAQNSGVDTRNFLQNLSSAAIVHKQVIDSIAASCNEQAQAVVVKTGDYPIELFRQTRTALYAYGLTPQQAEFH